MVGGILGGCVVVWLCRMLVLARLIMLARLAILATGDGRKEKGAAGTVREAGKGKGKGMGKGMG